MFDPASTEGDSSDVVSIADPRVFTLFPKVTALENPVNVGESGSWSESNHETTLIETCVHTGTGLAEWSGLVVKGKEEEEERRERIEEELIREELAALEKQRRELEARGGRNSHSRHGSMAGSGSHSS